MIGPLNLTCNLLHNRCFNGAVRGTCKLAHYLVYLVYFQVPCSREAPCSIEACSRLPVLLFTSPAERVSDPGLSVVCRLRLLKQASRMLRPGQARWKRVRWRPRLGQLEEEIRDVIARLRSPLFSL